MSLSNKGNNKGENKEWEGGKNNWHIFKGTNDIYHHNVSIVPITEMMIKKKKSKGFLIIIDF